MRKDRSCSKGTFIRREEDDEDTERKATLKPTGVDADAAGEAEVEFAKSTPVEQEVEFTGRGPRSRSDVHVVIDGHDVATAKADSRGRAEVELDVSVAGARAGRLKGQLRPRCSAVWD